MVEAPGRGGADPRLGAKSDAEPGGAEHRQIVGPVSGGEGPSRRNPPFGRERQQGAPLGVAVDDRAQNPAGQASARDLKAIGDDAVETELGRDPVGKDCKAAGDQRRHGARPPHRRDQRSRPRGQADMRRGLVEDPGFGSRQQRDTGFERLGEIDLAVHRPPGDLGDARADPVGQRQLVEHLVLDDRRFEIGDEQQFAPPGFRLDQEIDGRDAERGARNFGDRRGALRFEDEVTGFLGSEPDRLGPDLQGIDERRGETGKKGIAPAGDQSGDDVHGTPSYSASGAAHKPAEAKSPPAPPVLIVAGPTASSKSALALELAQSIGGTIINADSLQCYRDLEILTARPDALALARAPHRLYGYLDAAERGSAGHWREAALIEIAAATAAGRLPIVVGGTGLYIRALTHGLAPFPEIPEAVREEAAALHRALGGAAFRERLAGLDADAARRLCPGDTQRLVRAYMVVRATGTPVGVWRSRPHPVASYRFGTILMMPPRDRLYAACDARFAAMVGNGALAEAAALARRRLDPSLPAMKAVGLSELLRHLRGETPLAQAISAAQRATRHYAKRQTTWFRHQMWPDLILAEQFSESLLRCSRQFIDALLTGRDSLIRRKGIFSDWPSLRRRQQCPDAI